MRSLIIAAIIALSTPVAGSAQTFRSVNYLDVLPLTATTFEVIESGGKGPRGVWCAAAEYAERRLRARGRIYVLEARGPSRSVQGRNSVIFTTDASSLSQGPSQSVLLSTSQVGIGLPIAHAIQFCRDADYRLFN